MLFSVFSAASYFTSPGAQTAHQFDVIIIDTTYDFDTTQTFYTTSSSGFYFMHLSAGGTNLPSNFLFST